MYCNRSSSFKHIVLLTSEGLVKRTKEYRDIAIVSRLADLYICQQIFTVCVYTAGISCAISGKRTHERPDLLLKTISRYLRVWSRDLWFTFSSRLNSVSYVSLSMLGYHSFTMKSYVVRCIVIIHIQGIVRILISKWIVSMNLVPIPTKTWMGKIIAEFLPSDFSKIWKRKITIMLPGASDYYLPQYWEKNTDAVAHLSSF